MNDDVWFRKPEPLGWPLAVLGCVIGYYASELSITLSFVGDRLCLEILAEVLPQSHLGFEERVMVSLIYAFSFGLAGRWMSSRLVDEAPPMRSMLLAVFAAPQMAGCFIGVFTLGRAWGWGALIGAVASAACAPFALLLAHNGRRAWEARAGTLLHASYRRARWIDVATAVVVLLALYANPVFGTRGHSGEIALRQQTAFVMIGIAVCMAAVIALRGSWALLDVTRLRQAFANATPGDENSETLGRETLGPETLGPETLGNETLDETLPVFDVGVGDARLHDVERGASAYRHRERIKAVCVGDLRRASRVLGLAVGRAVGVATLGAIVLFADVYVGVPIWGMCG